MEYRGHILIVFSLSLIFSPVAIRLVEERIAQNAEVAVPRHVAIQSEVVAECDRNSIQTVVGRLGCAQTDPSATVLRVDQRMTSLNTSRRISNTGALFVTPDN